MSVLLHRILLAVGGGAAVGAGYLAFVRTTVPDALPERTIEPGSPRTEAAPLPASQAATKTRYPLVNQILGKLSDAAKTANLPLGLLVGWVAKESGGKITSAPHPLNGEPDSERGFFQLTPSESKGLRLDHQRLSVDPDYSIDAGVKLIQGYAKKAEALGVAEPGSSYFWRLVKLGHTMGSGAEKKILDGARMAGAAGSWNALERYALENDSSLLHATGHSPKKWFPLVDDVYSIGLPFGFGRETATLVGLFSTEPTYSPRDIEALSRAVESCASRGTLAEKQAVAWACRNRARQAAVAPYAIVAPSGEYGAQGTGGRDFVSSRLDPTDLSTQVARAVLSLPQESDPTRGAVDFWYPRQQAHLALLGHLHPVEDVRRALAESGLRVCGLVGELELLST